MFADSGWVKINTIKQQVKQNLDCWIWQAKEPFTFNDIIAQIIKDNDFSSAHYPQELTFIASILNNPQVIYPSLADHLKDEVIDEVNLLLEQYKNTYCRYSTPA